MKISAIILTKRNEKNIDRCLKSVDFCDEKLVFEGQIEDFSKERNLGLEKARYEWVLFIDTDEEVTPKLSAEIQSVISNPQSVSAFYIKRRDFFWGRELKYGETMKIRNRGLIRLVKKNSGKWFGKVHEEFRANGPLGRLNNYLNHYPHQTLKEFIEKINYYSTLRAEELYQAGKKFYLHEVLLLPFFKFLLNYFVYFGLLDGVPGFVYAFLMSFHSFLVRAKLYKRA